MPMSNFAHLGSKCYKNQCQIWNQRFFNRVQANFVKIWKLILFDPKFQVWGFGLKIFENQCQIWNQHIQNRVYANFR